MQHLWLKTESLFSLWTVSVVNTNPQLVQPALMFSIRMNVHFLKLMVKKLGFASETVSLLCATIITAGASLSAGMHCSDSDSLLALCQNNLKPGDQAQIAEFFLASRCLSLTPGRSRFLCRNHREYVRVSFSQGR